MYFEDFVQYPPHGVFWRFCSESSPQCVLKILLRSFPSFALLQCFNLCGQHGNHFSFFKQDVDHDILTAWSSGWLAACNPLHCCVAGDSKEEDQRAAVSADRVAAGRSDGLPVSLLVRGLCCAERTDETAGQWTVRKGQATGCSKQAVIILKYLLVLYLYALYEQSVTIYIFFKTEGWPLQSLQMFLTPISSKTLITDQTQDTRASSLICLIVSVDVKHHVYLETQKPNFKTTNIVIARPRKKQPTELQSRSNKNFCL